MVFPVTDGLAKKLVLSDPSLRLALEKKKAATMTNGLGERPE